MTSESQKSSISDSLTHDGWKAVAFAALVTLLVFVANLYSPRFSPDSWAYLELSNRVFTDFYRYNTLRQFEHPGSYSNSFPPLWPVLLAVVRTVADLGIYTGYLLNFVVCLGLLVGLASLFTRLGFKRWVGAVSYLWLLGFPGFLDEAIAGRAIPLSLMLLTVAVLPLSHAPKVTISKVVMAGLLMGLACLTRFDALFSAGVVGIAYAVVYRASRSGRWYTVIVVFAVFAASLALVLSPWVAYGIVRFGKPLPSDNTRQVLSAQPSFVLDYHETPPANDFLERPFDWLIGFATKKSKIVAKGILEAIRESGRACALYLPWKSMFSAILESPGRWFCLPSPLVSLRFSGENIVRTPWGIGCPVPPVWGTYGLGWQAVRGIVK